VTVSGHGSTPPSPRLDAQAVRFGGPDTGELVAWVAGQGPALVLVHSVNAAASAAEVRPLFQRYRATRTVFALDLPGFGASERSSRAYTPRLMTDALHALLPVVQARCGPAPVDALAVSLGCEFLARAAAEAPQAFGRLALVSPTGFAGGRSRRGAPGSTYAMPGLLRALRGPGWGGAVFRGLTRPGVIRYFLRRTWGAREIDERLWADDVQLAREPGAEHAPLHFLSGFLFSADIRNVYDALPQPVWVAHGVRGDFTDYRGLAQAQAQAGGRWQVQVFDTGALPYFEQPAAFCAALDAFLGPA
jgi:pimeloyl-ACP methyl ester carboxylesterase